MNAGLESRPTATTLDLEELVTRAWNGQIRVPHFQRSFRWAHQDVLRLFDSIVKNYPVGSLLLWSRPAPRQDLELGALRIDAPAADSALWVVDGQQRIISLANALHPEGCQDPRFALAYDLRQKRFVTRPPEGDGAVVPLPVLFDLQRVLHWFADHHYVDEYKDHAFAITKTLREFKLPAYLVAEGEVEVLQDIFDRMNNYGKRLRRSEIFSALNAGVEGAAPERLTFDVIASRIDDARRFGVIDNDTVLHAVLARRGPNIGREIRNEFNAQGDEGRDAAYEAGEAALLRAVTFLQNEVGVPHIHLVAYRYLLVVLARFFALHPEPGRRNRELLRRWYWRAAVAGPGRFKGSVTGAARVLCTKIRLGDPTGSVRDLLEAVETRDRALPDLTTFRPGDASTKIALCAWWAKRPRSLTTGEIYQIEDLAEVLAERTTADEALHAIWPRLDLRQPQRGWAANQALMPAPDANYNEVYPLLRYDRDRIDDETRKHALHSHAMTEEMVEMLRPGRIGEFLVTRQQLLLDELAAFLTEQCDWTFDPVPPVVDPIVYDAEEGEEPGADRLF